MPASSGNIIPLAPKGQGNESVARDLARKGYAVFPCRPLPETVNGERKDEKSPYLTDWRTRATTDLDQIRHWWRKRPDALVGLSTGKVNGLAVLDIDRKNGKDGFAGLRAMGLDPDDLSPFMVETASGGRHVYFQWREGMGNSSKGLPEGCDVRGEGGYVIAAGSSGPLGRYRAIGKPLQRQIIGGLPEWPTALPVGPVGRKGTGAGAAPYSVPLAVLRDALMTIPNDGSNPDTESRDGWLGIGMALHHETEGSEGGRDLWHAWSALWPGYCEGATDSAWDSFTTGRNGALRTWASLRREAMHHGWTPPKDDPLWQAERARQLALFDCIPAGPAPRPDPITAEINQTYALVYHGGKALVAKTAGDKLELGSVQDLHNLFANWRVPTGKGDQTRPASYTWLESEHRRTYAGGIDFDPTGRDRKDVLNLWKGWATKPDPKASCDLIRAHVRDVICAGNADHAAYVLGWFAHLVQRPGEKPGVALVLRGPKGAGKDTLAVVLSRIIGQRHVAHVTRPEALTDRFNAPFATAMLGHVEEAYWAGDPSKKGALQALITAPTMPIEKKGIDPIEMPSFVRLLMTTNEDWAVPASADERRYAVFDVSPRHMQDPAYFGPLYAEIEGDGPAAFLAYLLDYDLTGYDVRAVPQTDALRDQKLASLRNLGRFWYEILHRGEVCEIDQWDESIEVECDDLRREYELWLRNNRHQGTPVTPQQFGVEMHKMVPGMRKHRPRRKSGSRPWCYQIPPLQECRESFATYIGQPVTWGDDT